MKRILVLASGVLLLLAATAGPAGAGAGSQTTSAPPATSITRLRSALGLSRVTKM